MVGDKLCGFTNFVDTILKTVVENPKANKQIPVTFPLWFSKYFHPHYIDSI